MSTRRRTQGGGGTGLGVEPLEARQMLAQYALAVNLYTDEGGVPGELVAGDSIQAGETFFVEITAEDLRDEPLGLGGLGLRVEWDPLVLEEIDTPFSPSSSASSLVTAQFPLFRSGWLDNEAGCIDSLHGLAFASLGGGQVIGEDGPERFALLHFRAEQPAQNSPLILRPRGVGFVPMREYTSQDLLIESQTIHVLEAVPSHDLASSTVPAPTAVTWQNPVNPLDVDGLEGVTPRDVLVTINFLNEHNGDAALPPPAAASPTFYYDVNGDQRCTALDALLIINFLSAAPGISAEGESAPAAERNPFAGAHFTDAPSDVVLQAAAACQPTAADTTPDSDLPATPVSRAAPAVPWNVASELEKTLELLARPALGSRAPSLVDLQDLLWTDAAFVPQLLADVSSGIEAA